ncbi:MAG TPA: ring-cleaving dioxygenase, partial [Chthoniobacterales bacterium]
VPAGSLGYWQDRLKARGVSTQAVFPRFGEDVLRFADPDGMIVELIDSGSAESGPAVQGFHSVSAALAETEGTARLLKDVFGYDSVQESGNRLRLSSPDASAFGSRIDLVRAPDAPPGRAGAGTVHHLAFRVPDDEAQHAWRERLVRLGYPVSPIMDRSYFHSIYFREPGGILFEIATDNPGFAADEPLAELGNKLCLPSWMERSRSRIETLLPPLHLSTAASV